MAKKVKSKESNADDITVIIGAKDEYAYIKACVHILKESNTCGIVARYKNFLKAINVYYDVMELLADKNGVTSLITLGESDPFKGRDGKLRTSKELLITVMVNGNTKDIKGDTNGKTTVASK